MIWQPTVLGGETEFICFIFKLLSFPCYSKVFHLTFPQPFLCSFNLPTFLAFLYLFFFSYLLLPPHWFVFSHFYFLVFCFFFSFFWKYIAKDFCLYFSSPYPFTMYTLNWVFPAFSSCFRYSSSHFLFLSLLLWNLDPSETLACVFYHLLLFNFAVVAENCHTVEWLSLCHLFKPWYWLNTLEQME